MFLGQGRRSHGFAAAAGLLAAALAAFLFAAVASAEVRSGSASDGTEPERLPAGQDVVAVSAAYDTTSGTITAAVTTRGAPEALPTRGLRTDFFPVDSVGNCVSPEARLASIYSEAAAFWVYDGSSLQPGVKSVVGNTTTLTATSPALVNQPFFCMDTYILDEEGEPFEGLVGPIKLAAPAPPPAPPSAPPASNPPPATTPPPAPKQAKLSLGPSKSLTVRRGRWKKVKLQVSNPGTATAAKVSLRLGKAKGVATKPKSGLLELKSIAPGKSKTASFELLLTKAAKASSTLTVKLTGAKGLKATGTLTVKAFKKKRGPIGGGKGKGKEAPVPAEPPLAETLFYEYEMQATESATLIGFAFLDGEWAYRGIPAGGLPSCTGTTGGPDKDGCLKYSFDPKSGTVEIESIGRGRITADGKLEIGGQTYLPTAIPEPGTRYQVEQEYGGYSGLCGLITGCSTWHEHLLLTAGGEFVLTRESLTTVGGSGPGETFVAAGSYPPDQRGTYEIEPRGRIRFSYADGSVKTKTIAILLNSAGRPDPVNAGLLLDSDYFNFLPDD